MLLSGLDPLTLLARLVTLAIGFTLHEFAHAWTAVQLGDETPRQTGRLTLNPLAHLDVLGSLLLVLVGFGWAKPVMTNPYNYRNPRKGLMLVSVAGPYANFFLVLLAAIPLRLGLLHYLAPAVASNVYKFFGEFLVVNLTLMLFNLIPLVPLDGSKILRGFAPPAWDAGLAQLEQLGPWLLMGLVFLGGSILGYIIGWPARIILTLLGL